MRDFTGKGAFITGGASGIGLGLARLFAEAGAQVAIVDVEAAALEAAAAELKTAGAEVLALQADVADRAALGRAGERAIAAFGKVHLLFNNAGVARTGRIWEIASSDWDWVIGVNLMGAINGLQIFVPHMLAHGEPSHVVTTSSTAGLRPGVAGGPYTATKHAVIGLSEILASELAGTNIGVSVFCPNHVQTMMRWSGRNRPARFGGPLDAATDREAAAHVATMSTRAGSAVTPREAALHVKRGIEAGDLFIVNRAEERGAVRARFERLMAAFDAAEAMGRPGSLG